MHKKHQRGDNSKRIKARALIFVARHLHDLFLISVKYHQKIPNRFQDIERTRKCLRTDEQMDRLTDATLITIFSEPFGRGIKRFQMALFLLTDKNCAKLF